MKKTDCKTIKNLFEGMTIYGEKMLDKILKLKAVSSISVNDNEAVVYLTDGREIRTTYNSNTI